jgi:hypothetical protein
MKRRQIRKVMDMILQTVDIGSKSACFSCHSCSGRSSQSLSTAWEWHAETAALIPATPSGGYYRSKSTTAPATVVADDFTACHPSGNGTRKPAAFRIPASSDWQWILIDPSLRQSTSSCSFDPAAYYPPGISTVETAFHIQKRP